VQIGGSFALSGGLAVYAVEVSITPDILRTVDSKEFSVASFTATIQELVREIEAHTLREGILSGKYHAPAGHAPEDTRAAALTIAVTPSCQAAKANGNMANRSTESTF